MIFRKRFIFPGTPTPLAVCALLLLAAGCNSLTAGDVQAIKTAPASEESPMPVILIRGWRDLYSDGIDRLADSLRKEGIPAQVYKESQWQEVSDVLMSRWKGERLAGPIILVGFSYGADDVIEISRRLAKENRAVRLLVLIDPVTPGYVPFVRRCVNFYQPNGVWDVFPWLRGVPVEHDPKALQGSIPAGLENINVRERTDLNASDMSHKTIAGNGKIHAAIVEEVKKARKSGF